MPALAWLMVAIAVLASPARAGAAELVVWISYDAREWAGFEKVVAAYNARIGTDAPRATMKKIGFDGMADKIAAAIPRGKGPDVFVFPQDRLGGWVEAGRIVEPLPAHLSSALRASFIPAAAEAMVYRGRAYGLPLNVKTIALVRNRKLVPDAPRTTAELEAAAIQHTDRAAGRYGLAYLYDNYYWHAALQNGFGGGPFDRQIRPTLDSPENVRAMKLLLRWRELFLPESPLRELSRAAFNEGRLAMIFEGPWFLGEVSPAIDLGVSSLPRLSESGQPLRPWMTVDGVFVSAESRQKEAAWAFAAFATGVEAGRIMALQGAQLPANQHIYADVEVSSDPVRMAFYRQAADAIAMPNVYEMTAMWSPATVAMGSVLSGASTPEAALAKAQGKLTRAIAELWARTAAPPR